MNGTPEFIDGGAGIDTLNTTAFGGNYLVNLTTGATNFAGESFINMENIVAGVGNDTLIGTAGANVMNGGAGNELDGRSRRQRRHDRWRRQRHARRRPGP